MINEIKILNTLCIKNFGKHHCTALELVALIQGVTLFLCFIFNKITSLFIVYISLIFHNSVLKESHSSENKD